MKKFLVFMLAMAVQKMIESGLKWWFSTRQLTGKASAQMFEHVHLGQVTRIPLVTSWLKLLRT